jgi:hypothetical protein
MSSAPRRSRLARRHGCAALVALALAPLASASSPPIVPWLNQRPVKAPPNPPLAPPCKAADLRTHLFLQGATGSLVGGITLLNAGATACSLVGRPSFSFTGAAAAAERWRVKKLAASSAPPDVLADPPGSLRALQPGKSAGIQLFWSNWCGPGAVATGASGAPPDAIVLGLASGTRISVRVTQAPRCDAPQYPSTVSVGPLTPTERHLPESSRLPLRVVVAGSRTVPVKPGLRAFRVHRGERFRYVVAVSNTGAAGFRFPRTSCPSYIEDLTPWPEQTYVLNCRAAWTIAPRATMLFAMEIEVPATARLGIASLTWELAPKTYEAPFASAALWVVP